jgi:hypothetical protein
MSRTSAGGNARNSGLGVSCDEIKRKFLGPTLALIALAVGPTVGAALTQVERQCLWL